MAVGQEVGEVAERSNATDCKSVALVASEVRILPSPPLSSRFSGVEAHKEAAVSGGSNSVVESQPSKLLVAGSIPVSRSIFAWAARAAGGPRARRCRRHPGAALDGCETGRCSSVVERVLGKDEVTGSSPVIGSSFLLTSRRVGKRR